VGDYGLTDYLSQLGWGSGGGDAAGAAAGAADTGGSFWGGEGRRAAEAPGAQWDLSTLLNQGSRQPAQNDTWNSVNGWLSKLAKGDRETEGQAKLGVGALGMLSSLLQSRRSRGQLTPQQLQAMLASKYNNWTPGQQQSFNNYFYKPLPQFKYQPPRIMNPTGMARGGGVHRAGCGCSMCHGGALGRYAAGGAFVSQGAGTGGQGDAVSARLSPGEYVMDADVVSALGDGDNASGAAKLDEMRERIRAHKRGAPADSIPPKAKSPLAYLKGARRGA
jgi:hypothetical protein